MLNKHCPSLISNWKENLTFFVLGVFLVALPTSVALVSISAVALLVVWVLTGDYKTKWKRLIQNKSALLLMSIPVLYLIGLFFTHNFSVGLQEFNKSLYWFIFAFVLGSSPPISSKNISRLLGIYILTVTIAAGVALFKLFFVDTINFFDFRAVTWIDHVPFSYQIAFSVWMILYFMIAGKFSRIQKILLSLLIIFLAVSLLAFKSFNGYLFFGVMSFTALVMLALKTKKRVYKYIFCGILISIIVIPIFYVYRSVQKFYDITEYRTDEIDNYTSLGNKYKHDFENKTKENGNYVMLFICEEELIPLWNTNSAKNYHSSTSHDYPFSIIIIRYMTSKGLRKDADGFAQLTPKDIENIENEMPNYIYAKSKWSIYPRVYETIWELDQYKIYNNPDEKTLAKRIELAILAVDIIKKSPWVGIGLGNSALAYEEAIAQSGSKLASLESGSSVNQYLNYLIRFGILGTLYILGVVIWVFLKERSNQPFLLTIFFVSMLVVNFGDTNLETFIGINFFAFFMCFLIWGMQKVKPSL